MDTITLTSVTGAYMNQHGLPADTTVESLNPELLTASRMKAYGLCRRKEQLRYTAQYAQAVDSEPLIFGKAMHAFLEAWWSADSPTRDNAFDALMPFMSQLDADTFFELNALARGYHSTWLFEQANIETLGVEMEFRAPLLHPDDLGKEEQRVHVDFQLAGKIDAMARVVGKTTVVEHKTTSETIESDADKYWDKLLGDHQLSNYMVGADALGMPAEQALYDVIRKVQLRQGKKETKQEYYTRVEEDIKTRPTYYFRRRIIPRMTPEIVNYLRDAWDIATDLEMSRCTGVAPRNPEACFDWGRKCEYYEYCYLDVPLSQIDGLVKKAPHSELNVNKEVTQ